jgi:tryptophanyl-tRNA synthetase
MKKKRVLSGIRASGRLHLGNYLGAMVGMLKLQDDPAYETLYMVADLHALTTPHTVEELRQNRREVLIDYLAAGLDPEKSILFQQADNPHHAELAFYLSSTMSIARMQHLPTFKDKVKQHPDHATMALLNYPILMAADILLYKASAVPVGLDQEPHLEVTREIARKMNQEYGMDFPEPTRFKTTGEYVPSLTGEGKMGKSVEGSYINLSDDYAAIKMKIARIPTDSGMGEKALGGARITLEGPKTKVDTEQNKVITKVAEKQYIDRKTGQPSPGVNTLFTLVKLFQGEEKVNEYEEAYFSEQGLRYSDVKKDLADALYKSLEPFQEKRRYYEEHDDEVTEIIAAGNAKATELAEQTVVEVRENMGLK